MEEKEKSDKRKSTRSYIGKEQFEVTATLKRKDGKERIAFLQFGSVWYKDLSKVASELRHEVFVLETGMTESSLKEESYYK